MEISHRMGIPRIPARREIPKAWEIPQSREFPGIPVWEIPGREKFEAIQKGGNGSFPLNILVLQSNTRLINKQLRFIQHQVNEQRLQFRLHLVRHFQEHV